MRDYTEKILKFKEKLSKETKEILPGYINSKELPVRFPIALSGSYISCLWQDNKAFNDIDFFCFDEYDYNTKESPVDKFLDFFCKEVPNRRSSYFDRSSGKKLQFSKVYTVKEKREEVFASFFPNFDFEHCKPHYDIEADKLYISGRQAWAIDNKIALVTGHYSTRNVYDSFNGSGGGIENGIELLIKTRIRGLKQIIRGYSYPNLHPSYYLPKRLSDGNSLFVPIVSPCNPDNKDYHSRLIKCVGVFFINEDIKCIYRNFERKEVQGLSVSAGCQRIDNIKDYITAVENKKIPILAELNHLEDDYYKEYIISAKREYVFLKDALNPKAPKEIRDPIFQTFEKLWDATNKYPENYRWKNKKE